MYMDLSGDRDRTISWVLLDPGPKSFFVTHVGPTIRVTHEMADLSTGEMMTMGAPERS